MEFITEKLLNILACAETTQLERMKLKLGLQVLCHNIWMTCVILILAGYLRLFQESFILFISYGILKIHVGGIHFHKSWQCLTVTTSFIIGGVLLLSNSERENSLLNNGISRSYSLTVFSSKASISYSEAPIYTVSPR